MLARLLQLVLLYSASFRHIFRPLAPHVHSLLLGTNLYFRPIGSGLVRLPMRHHGSVVLAPQSILRLVRLQRLVAVVAPFLAALLDAILC